MVGLDAPEAGRLLSEVLGRPTRADRVAPLPGGASNLTWRADADGTAFVLRRGPGGARGNAHDMVRERDVLAVAHERFALAPGPHGVAAARDGSPVLVMEYLDGRVPTLGRGLDASAAQATGLCRAFVATLAALHRATRCTAGRGRLRAWPDFTQRQVAGWARRFRAHRPPGDRATLVAWLSDHVPPPRDDPCLLHNDYKLENLVLDPDDPTRIVGVLDWELAGIGDRRLDLGNALACWVEAGDPAPLHLVKRGPTDRPGMATRAELVAWYDDLLDPGPAHETTFFEVFGQFRLATIALQLDARARARPAYDGHFGACAEILLDRADTLLAGAAR